MMSGIAEYLTALELQILSINVLGLAGSTLNWSWLKWDQQLEKIWNLSVSQSDELNAKNIEWLKTILSWIVSARFVIDHLSLLAYVANICTILARKWQNLLVLWMGLSFLRDIILEIVVIIITFLLWYEKSVSTTHFVEFIAEKTVRLFFLIYKWCTTLKWYTQLHRVEKVRKFTIIARRSIANIVHVPGKARHSLDDEYLSPATARRSKFASLLNLDELPEESSSRVNFELRTFKSLTTLVTDDSHATNETNNHDPIANDLSVAEKSMKMLNITAEDVMDARARIQERPYWEQDAMAESTEEVMAQFSLEKVEQKMDDAAKNEKTVMNDVKETVDQTLRKENIMQHSLIEKKREKDTGKIASMDNKEQILTKKQEEIADILLAKNGAPEKKKKGEPEKAVKIVQCPSSINMEDMEAKPCAAFIKKLEEKLCCTPINQEEKWTDQKIHPCQVETKLTATNSNKIKFYKNPKTLCACHRVILRNTNISKSGKYTQSTNINEFKRVAPAVDTQKGKVNEYNSLKYSEMYRIKKQIKKSEESVRKQSSDWGSVSLALTAHPSGYAKNVVATNKISNGQKNIRTETFDKSNDSLSAQHKLKHIERSGRSADLRSIYKTDTAFKGKNYAESAAYNNLTLLENKREIRARKRHDLPPNHKLSVAEREAMERNTSRACNKLTLLESKKEFEARKNRDSNDEDTTKKSEVPEMNGTYNDLTLLVDEKGIKTTSRRNLPPNCEQSMKESSSLKNRNELSEDSGELQAGERHSTRYETPSKCEEDVETPTSVTDRLSEANNEGTVTSSFEAHRSANSGAVLNDRVARHVRTSLNLREITRNIERTVHPRGVVLANKNLHGQFLENGRSRESRQRDIADGSTANALHRALFSKPEIVTPTFRRAQRIGESFPRIPTFLREDFNTEFVCRVNNETGTARDWDSLFSPDRERTPADRSDRGNSHANDSRVANEEESRDLCTIFHDPERAPAESETGIIDDSATASGSREDASCPSAGNIQTNILTFDESGSGNRCQMDNATNDNLPVQSIVDVLKNFAAEVPEGSVRETASSSVEQLEERGNASDAIVDNNFQARKFNTNDINSAEENNNKHCRVSLERSADINKTIDDQSEQAQSSKRSDDADVVSASSVTSSEHDNPYKVRDEKYLNATNIYSKDEITRENISLVASVDNATLRLSDNNINNNQFNPLINKTEKNMFNRILENSSKLSLPGPSSFVESDDNHTSARRSSDEKLERLTPLLDSVTTLENRRSESVLNLGTTNDDTISQFRDNEIFKLKTTIQDNTRNDDEGREVIYGKTNEFSINRFFRINSAEKLQQDDSFFSTYERNNGSSDTRISLESSLMEEFSNDIILPGISLDASAQKF